MIERPTDYEVIEAYMTLLLRSVVDRRTKVDARIDRLDMQVGDMTAASNRRLMMRRSDDALARLYGSWRDSVRWKELSPEFAKKLAKGIMAEVAKTRFGRIW